MIQFLIKLLKLQDQFLPVLLINIKKDAIRRPDKQVTGIEPASSAWEADVLPMNYTCIIYNFHILL